MKALFDVFVQLCVCACTSAKAPPKPVTSLQIGTHSKPDVCPVKSRVSDVLTVHYKVWILEGFESRVI